MTLRSAELVAGLAMIAAGGILAWTAVLMVVFAPWPSWLEPRPGRFRGDTRPGRAFDPEATEPQTWPLGAGAPSGGAGTALARGVP